MLLLHAQVSEKPDIEMNLLICSGSNRIFFLSLPFINDNILIKNITEK